MGIRRYKSMTPGRRGMSVSDFAELTTSKPTKKLLATWKRSGGRNARGRITVRRRGGGHKRRVRIIDRQALHASLLEFDHPISCNESKFTAPLHADMQLLVSLLREYRFKRSPTVPSAILDLETIIKN
ncbi:hypothetical protein H8D29_03255 [PVC group bacterium]|nr:hypothetical protein [PVC group bacterium]